MLTFKSMLFTLQKSIRDYLGTLYNGHYIMDSEIYNVQSLQCYYHMNEKDHLLHVTLKGDSCCILIEAANEEYSIFEFQNQIILFLFEVWDFI